jgi:predicted N-acetyltransferase YhbS
MNNTEYLVASPADRDDCLDFGNFVFSQAHAPHDFKQLLPKVYGDNVNCAVEAKHFIARRDGRIRAMVACLPTVMHYLDRTLNIGFVGTVSVHPYARGEGHMKRLMADMYADAQAQGYDMLALGGLRQRYGYFGFNAAGVCLSFNVTSTNLRHCTAELDCSDVTLTDLTEERPDEVDFAYALSQSRPIVGERTRERFLDIVHSWKCRCRLIRIGGEPVGYIMDRAVEVVLKDENLLPKVLKALFAADGLNSVDIAAAPCEKERIAVLSALCESNSHDQ